MYRKLLREFFLLSRGEQRSMIMVSILLILSLGVRIGVHLLPPPGAPGTDAITEQAHLIMAEFRRLDSLEALADSMAAVRRGNRKTYSPESLPAVPLELNSADSTLLLPLPGIGPVFAGRIIKYRELLGGYVTRDQLLEVYGMDSARYLPLSSLVSIDTSLLRRLDINQASFRVLLSHPYLEYEDVLALVRYRDRVGYIVSIDELFENAVLSDRIYQRIWAYLE